jgi:hypothetical protein
MLIELCWHQDPLKRPTFPEIVEFGHGDVLAIPGTDMDEYMAYQEEMVGRLTSQGDW